MSQAGIINVAGGGGGGSPVETLTGNSGGAVPPTANNIFIKGTGAVLVTGDIPSSTLTISVNTDSFTWSDKAASFNAFPQNGYFCTGLLTVTMPLLRFDGSALQTGDTIIIFVDTSSVVIVLANGTNSIQVGKNISVAGGSISTFTDATDQGTTVMLVYRVSDTTWHSISSVGNWSVT